ncbi:MAG: endolytic transglycosylase MltG [Dehalobacterium sp.]|jgi:UPF0755 protein
MAKRSRKKGKKGIIILVLIAILAASFIGLFIRPVPVHQEVFFRIPEQATTSDIAQMLESEGLIRHHLPFKLYTRLTGLDGKLKAGEYSFTGQVSLWDIGEKISRGQAQTKKVTIPEGYNLIQIAQLLAENGFVDQDKFLEVAQTKNFPYPYLPPPNSPERLEGFLFPDTYQITPGWPEDKVIAMMLKRFDDVFLSEWHDRAREIGMTIHEIVTLASIIEKEAKVPEDRPVIASVFYNRIKSGMHLESCATVQYALGEVKQVLLYEDLKIDSPYNTYLHGGLPPGPIACPGKASLEAALYPADSNFYYFVAKSDGSHYFSRTLAEHNEGKRKY